MNKKLLISIFIGILVVSLIIVLIIGLFLNSRNSNLVQNTSESTQKGLSLSPNDYSQSGIDDFFTKTKECCKVVSWAGNISDILDENSGAAFLMKAAPSYNLTPVIIIGVKEIPSLIQENEYNKAIVQFVKTYNPKYLGFGNEINKELSGDLDRFSTWFNQLYELVKTTSPETQIFTVFQYENLKGLNGGLFGGVNDETKTQWEILSKFDNADFLAFTTYPGLIYKDPSEIPSDYWSVISAKTDKPIAITETAWFKDEGISGWESSAEEQIKYVEMIPNLSKSLHMKFIIWPFLYDSNNYPKPFKTTGLIDPKNNSLDVFNTWVNLNLNQ